MMRLVLVLAFLSMVGCAMAQVVGFNHQKRTVSVRVNAFGSEATARKKAIEYCGGSGVDLMSMHNQTVGSSTSVEPNALYTNNTEEQVFTYRCR